MTARRRAVLAVAVVLLLLTPASRAQAFDYDTHYVWTYYLALHVGYSPRQAYQIASATFAVDHDAETGPLEASAFEALRNAPTPTTENIWTRFHAFADARYSSLEEMTPGRTAEILARLEGEARALVERGLRQSGSQAFPFAVLSGDPGMVQRLRDADAARLWNLGLEEGNPGPYLHFLQDTFSHRDYDSRHGHLYASHAPDYLSYNPERSREMTVQTIRALENFARAQGIAARPVDMNRVFGVLQALIDTNPSNWGATYLDELIQAAIDKAPTGVKALGLLEAVQVLAPGTSAAASDALAFVPKVSGTGSPNGQRAWRIVIDAIEADRVANRLPSFPEVWFDQTLPPKWFQYDYDGSGRTAHATVNRDRFAVEWPEVVVGDAQLSCTPEPGTRDLVRLTLRVPYEIRGAASLNFQHPLPIYNTSTQSDSGAQKPGTLERENGRHAIERYVLRSRASLAAQPATWTETIAVGPGNQRAVVETPLTCGAPPRRTGPVRVECPASPALGPARYVSDSYKAIRLYPRRMEQFPWDQWRHQPTGADQDGTYCVGGFCTVVCAYGPAAPAGQTTIVSAAWWADESSAPALDKACSREAFVKGSNVVQGRPYLVDGFEGPDAHAQERSRLLGVLRQAVEPNSLACPGGSVPDAAEAARIHAISWVRPQTTNSSTVRGDTNAGENAVVPPPVGTGAARISFGGRTVEATYEQQTDERGAPIDIYFYRTPPAPGGQAPGAEQQWSRFVRVPSARTTSSEPAVWWHARWEYGPKGWVYVQDRGVSPPQAAR